MFWLGFIAGIACTLLVFFSILLFMSVKYPYSLLPPEVQAEAMKIERLRYEAAHRAAQRRDLS